MGIRERKSRERERRRQQIMVAARRVFSEKGFSKATMEDIAREAELSAGTLYLYFKSKDELFSSLSIRILQFLNLRLEHSLNHPETMSSEQKICALKKVLYDVFEFDPMFLINMFHLQSSDTLKNLSPDLLSEIRELSRKSIRMMSGYFEDGILDGDYVENKPVIFAHLVWALFSGIVLWEESKRMIDSDKQYLKETLDSAFDIFLRGIKKNAVETVAVQNGQA
jgi:AcrR family transcriptional regulator